jgi:glycosyltransferase involved in cell wall biosynthesis
MYAKLNKDGDEMKAADTEDILKVLHYPIAMSSFPMLLPNSQDTAAVSCNENSSGNHPTTIAQYALVHWNQYLTTEEKHHCNEFLMRARWLVEHEVRIGETSGGWPISSPHSHIRTTGSWLSALTQGCSISVLVRAYQLTHEEAFLEVAGRAIRTFEHDIFDGGVSTPIGNDGVFFEEVAVYPAAHVLSSFIFALFGLYDYVALTGNIQIKQLIHRSLATLHKLLDEFDTGFWTRSDLLHRHLASPSLLTLQVELLEALAKYSGCDHCLILVSRWKSYQHRLGTRLYYVMNRCWYNFSRAFSQRIQAAFFPNPHASPFVRVCVSVPAFPAPGGVFTVLDGIARITKDIWQIEYLTHKVGPHPESYVIHRFGTARMGYWQFPIVWFHVLAGCRKFISLMYHGAGYQVVLPQDGVFTGALAAFAGKVTGVRVVCIDHGHLTLLKSRTYRAERIKFSATRAWYRHLLSRLLYVFYWPSLYLLALIAAQFVDHFLVPGIEGDGVEEICQSLGVPPSRLTRFASMINVDHHVVLDALPKVQLRKEKGFAADAIVVAVICRLAPEKGLEIALESISSTLFELSPALRTRVRIVIAGDGPLRHQIEKDIEIHGLGQTCVLWGDVPEEEVISLLAISDIFLYTSTRGACFPMAVLEAMASGCAVIASTQPPSNAHLLAGGRGIAVPEGDVEQTCVALLRLVNDLELCRKMGKLARDYITMYHSPISFRQTLQRASYWEGLDEILGSQKKEEVATVEKE